MSRYGLCSTNLPASVCNSFQPQTKPSSHSILLRPLLRFVDEPGTATSSQRNQVRHCQLIDSRRIGHNARFKRH